MAIRNGSLNVEISDQKLLENFGIYLQLCSKVSFQILFVDGEVFATNPEFLSS